MSHDEIFRQFKKYCPVIAERMRIWFPNGLNSIRVFNEFGCDYIFTFFPKTDTIMLEPREYFVKRLESENRHKTKKGD